MSSFAKICSREIFEILSFAKISSREMTKKFIRENKLSRKLIPLRYQQDELILRALMYCINFLMHNECPMLQDF